MVFNNMEFIRKASTYYEIRHGRKLLKRKNLAGKYKVICDSSNCKWTMGATRQQDMDIFIVTRCYKNDMHICVKIYDMKKFVNSQ